MHARAITRIMLTALLLEILPLALNFGGGSVFADHWWNIETVDSTGNVGLYNSLALDSSDRPHISYYDIDYGDLKYTHFNGSWNPETADSDGGVFTSLALDSSDRPHISYYDGTNFDLKYAYYNGGWSIETVDSAGNVGYFNSLALDSSDRPHISYVDDTNFDLKYTYASTQPWDVTGPTAWIPDGKCDIRDVAIVALRFGSENGDEIYDARADITGPVYLQKDGKIDICDVALVALHFGE